MDLMWECNFPDEEKYKTHIAEREKLKFTLEQTSQEFKATNPYDSDRVRKLSKRLTKGSSSSKTSSEIDSVVNAAVQQLHKKQKVLFDLIERESENLAQEMKKLFSQFKKAPQRKTTYQPLSAIFYAVRWYEARRLNQERKKQGKEEAGSDELAPCFERRLKQCLGDELYLSKNSISNVAIVIDTLVYSCFRTPKHAVSDRKDLERKHIGDFWALLHQLVGEQLFEAVSNKKVQTEKTFGDCTEQLENITNLNLKTAAQSCIKQVRNELNVYYKAYCDWRIPGKSIERNDTARKKIIAALQVFQSKATEQAWKLLGLVEAQDHIDSTTMARNLLFSIYEVVAADTEYLPSESIDNQMIGCENLFNQLFIAWRKAPYQANNSFDCRNLLAQRFLFELADFLNILNDEQKKPNNVVAHLLSYLGKSELFSEQTYRIEEKAREIMLRNFHEYLQEICANISKVPAYNANSSTIQNMKMGLDGLNSVFKLALKEESMFVKGSRKCETLLSAIHEFKRTDPTLYKQEPHYQARIDIKLDEIKKAVDEFMLSASQNAVSLSKNASLTGKSEQEINKESAADYIRLKASVTNALVAIRTDASSQEGRRTGWQNFIVNVGSILTFGVSSVKKKRRLDKGVVEKRNVDKEQSTAIDNIRRSIIMADDELDSASMMDAVSKQDAFDSAKQKLRSFLVECGSDIDRITHCNSSNTPEELKRQAHEHINNISQLLINHVIKYPAKGASKANKTLFAVFEHDAGEEAMKLLSILRTQNQVNRSEMVGHILMGINKTDIDNPARSSQTLQVSKKRNRDTGLKGAFRGFIKEILASDGVAALDSKNAKIRRFSTELSSFVQDLYNKNKMSINNSTTNDNEQLDSLIAYLLINLGSLLISADWLVKGVQLTAEQKFKKLKEAIVLIESTLILGSEQLEPADFGKKKSASKQCGSNYSQQLGFRALEKALNFTQKSASMLRQQQTVLDSIHGLDSRRTMRVITEDHLFLTYTDMLSLGQNNYATTNKSVDPGTVRDKHDSYDLKINNHLLTELSSKKAKGSAFWTGVGDILLAISGFFTAGTIPRIAMFVAEKNEAKAKEAERESKAKLDDFKAGIDRLHYEHNSHYEELFTKPPTSSSSAGSNIVVPIVPPLGNTTSKPAAVVN